LAEDCLLPRLFEGLFTRKLTLKLDESAAIYDPQETLMVNILFNFFEEIYFAATLA